MPPTDTSSEHSILEEQQQRALIETVIQLEIRRSNELARMDKKPDVNRGQIQHLGFQAVPDGELCGTLSEEQKKAKAAEVSLPELTDVGVRLLATEDFGLTALRSLSLADFPVTDLGIQALSRATNVLQSLEFLEIYGSQVSDVGIRDLSRSDTSLKNLKVLYGTRNKNMTVEGLKLLARSDSGLLKLEDLTLEQERLNDDCLREFVRADSGLKRLQVLYLRGSQVTEVGLKTLAAPDSGLADLNELDLDSTSLTLAVVKEFTRSDSKLRSLEYLDISGPEFTDDCFDELARPDSGFENLKRVILWNTGVSKSRLDLVPTRWPQTAKPYSYKRSFPPVNGFRHMARFRGLGPKKHLQSER